MSSTIVEANVEMQIPVHANSNEPIHDPLETESPRLSRIHAATNAVVEKLLKRDPKRFQELSSTQKSGQ